MVSIPYKTIFELSTTGPTQIGQFRICGNGLQGGSGIVGGRIKRVPDAERGPVRRYQVDIAKKLLTGCRATRWARTGRSPMSCELKHWAENWGGPECMAAGYSGYISTGAAIVAAIEVGFRVVPTGEGSRNVLIGVHFGDVAARMAERGWHIEPGWTTALRIKEPVLQSLPVPDPEFWRKSAADHGIGISEPEQKPDLAQIIGGDGLDDVPPQVWQDIAEAFDLVEDREG